MQKSDSLFIPYLLVGIASIICCIKLPLPYQNHHRALTYLFSIVLALFVIVANHQLFPSFSLSTIFTSCITIVSLVAGSFIAFYNIFQFLSTFNKFSLQITSVKKPSRLSTSLSTPGRAFLLSFLLISLVYLLVFFLCKCPGNLSFDSLNQVEQGLTGDYSNHHPFIHTIIIQFFVSIGQNLFGSLNAGVATYSVFQILLMSSIFAFSISTLFRFYKSHKLVIIMLLIFTLTPYHIMYSMTIWKDCLLGAFMLLLVVSEYRILKALGPKWLNYLLLFVGGLGTCLFKGNGLYIFLAFFVVFIILYFRKIFQTKTLLPNFFLLLITILAAFSYNKLILPAFNVASGEIMESLSIPAQQIARVVTTSSENLSSEQQDLLAHISNLAEIPQVYNPHLSDPIKEQVWRSSGGEKYLAEHKGEYLKLYLELGIKHPLLYLEAWSDQTKGYFNGGYKYWVISNDITPNDLGIYQTKLDSAPNKVFNAYLSIFEDNEAFRIIYCIGFFTWVILALLFIALAKKDRDSILLTSVPIFLIATLLLATPVYSEFRYAYPLLCCTPFLFVIIIFSQTQKPKNPKIQKPKIFKLNYFPLYISPPHLSNPAKV